MPARSLTPVPCVQKCASALNNAIKAKGISKLALGHHFDDVVETRDVPVL